MIGHMILCCPEDIRCTRQHLEAHALCYQCEIPLCRSCFFTSQQRDAYGIPEAMANDNFSGYVTDVIYKYKVRWIEAAAACPVFTALITYYVEGDRGHLMNEQMHRPQRAYAVRGNAFSFHMPWEKVMEQLGRVLEEDHLDALPHPPEVLSSMVIFSLRIGDVTDLDKYLPQARLRPHVVLKLCLALLDSGYPFKESAQILRKRFAELVSLRYPEKEAHLPEDQRQGTIPPEIEKSIRESLRPIPGEREKGIKQKHATPAEAPRVTAEALEDLRPSSCFPDRESFNVAPRDSQELVAMRKHYLLEAATDVELISQWNSNYFAEAFPFSVPRVVGGADFPWKKRPRRLPESPELEPLPWARMLATRVEASIRNDWQAIPSARNLSTKHKALCGKDLACRHAVDNAKAGVETAAELTEAAETLYQKLAKGHWWDGRKKRKINHDVTKLQYAVGLSNPERDLVKDLAFLSSTLAGTQQIRLDIGHALFGARVELGDPLFFTISPSSRHSGMCVRLSRYRETDPAVQNASILGPSIAPWSLRTHPESLASVKPSQAPVPAIMPQHHCADSESDDVGHSLDSQCFA